jgi:hypothetical protein
MIYDKPILNRGPLWLREINDMEHEPYEQTSPLPRLLSKAQALVDASGGEAPRASAEEGAAETHQDHDARPVEGVGRPVVSDHYYCEDCDEQIAMEDVDQILDDMEPTCPHCGECVDFVYAEPTL